MSTIGGTSTVFLARITAYKYLLALINGAAAYQDLMMNSSIFIYFRYEQVDGKSRLVRKEDLVQ